MMWAGCFAFQQRRAQQMSDGFPPELGQQQQWCDRRARGAGVPRLPFCPWYASFALALHFVGSSTCFGVTQQCQHPAVHACLVPPPLVRQQAGAQSRMPPAVTPHPSGLSPAGCPQAMPRPWILLLLLAHRSWCRPCLTPLLSVGSGSTSAFPALHSLTARVDRMQQRDFLG